MSPSVPHVASVLFLACLLLALANPDNPTFLSPAGFPSSLLFWSPTTITLVCASVRAGERTGRQAGRQAEGTLCSSPVHLFLFFWCFAANCYVSDRCDFGGFLQILKSGRERERERCEDV
jgi:hypothetical protein